MHIMMSSYLEFTDDLTLKQPLLAGNFVGSAMLIISFFMHDCSIYPFTNISVFDGMTIVY